MTASPLRGRAVAASPSSPTVSPVPASIPDAGSVLTERERLVGKYLALWERWNEDRLGRRAKPLQWPWIYRAGLNKALGVVRARIDMLDQQRLAA